MLRDLALNIDNRILFLGERGAQLREKRGHRGAVVGSEWSVGHAPGVGRKKLGLPVALVGDRLAL
jgi:hypothetical protein